MIAVKGRCTHCKTLIDIMDPGIVCSQCEKYYHGKCLTPVHNLKMLQKLVISTKNWYCSNCIGNVVHTNSLRTKENKKDVQKKIDIVIELRKILTMIDTAMSEMNDQCEELTRNAEELRTENNSLKRRIILHKIHGGETPVNFIDWHSKRKLLQINDYAAPKKLKEPKAGAAIAVKNALFSYVQKKHNWRIRFRRKEAVATHPILEHAMEHHRLGRTERAAFVTHVWVNKIVQKSSHRFFLWILIFLYTIIGALVFYIIEGLLNEFLFIQQVETRRDEVYRQLQELSSVNDNILIEQPVVINKTAQLMSDYFEFVEGTINEYDDKVSLVIEDMNWDFTGSIIFTATTCMTIGYGTIRPVTPIGKILTIAYATAGVPLFLVLVATLSRAIIIYLRLLLHKIKKCRKGRDRTKSRGTLAILFIDPSDEEHPNLPFWLVFILELLYILVGTVIVMVVDDPNFLQSFNFIFESITTVGFGFYVPVSEIFIVGLIVYFLGGMAITVVGINVIEDIYRKRLNFASTKLGMTTHQYIEQNFK